MWVKEHRVSYYDSLGVREGCWGLVLWCLLVCFSFYCCVVLLLLFCCCCCCCLYYSHHPHSKTHHTHLQHTHHTHTHTHTLTTLSPPTHHTLNPHQGFNEPLVKAIAQWVTDEAANTLKQQIDTSSWTLDATDAPQQHNGCDCGMFMLAYAEHLVGVGVVVWLLLLVVAFLQSWRNRFLGKDNPSSPPLSFHTVARGTIGFFTKGYAVVALLVYKSNPKQTHRVKSVVLGTTSAGW